MLNKVFSGPNLGRSANGVSWLCCGAQIVDFVVVRRGGGASSGRSAGADGVAVAGGIHFGHEGALYVGTSVVGTGKGGRRNALAQVGIELGTGGTLVPNTSGIYC